MTIKSSFFSGESFSTMRFFSGTNTYLVCLGFEQDNCRQLIVNLTKIPSIGQRENSYHWPVHGYS